VRGGSAAEVERGEPRLSQLGHDPAVEVELDALHAARRDELDVHDPEDETDEEGSEGDHGARVF